MMYHIIYQKGFLVGKNLARYISGSDMVLANADRMRLHEMVLAAAAVVYCVVGGEMPHSDSGVTSSSWCF
jgi:hypothetical protein